MNIKNLSYIHDLLRKTEEQARTMADWGRQSWLHAEETSGANSAESKKLKAEYDVLRARHSAAYDALQDFSVHEWR